MPIAKNKGGRPPKTVDLNLVSKLASVGCTQEEIAFTLDVSVDTLARTDGFAETYKRGEAMGRQSLRHKQYQVAMSGDRTMLIWLGKQRLGQKDSILTEHTGEMAVTDGARERLLSKLAGIASAAQSAAESDQSIN